MHGILHYMKFKEMDKMNAVKVEQMFKKFEDKRIIQCRDLSNNPADNYLKVVLAEYKGEYVTWLFNTTLNGGNGGFVYGHYFGDNFHEASQDYYKRT
jgi:hypothetical protein